jgi:DNA-binding transcriptional MerR regulator
MTIKEIAELCGVEDRTVRYWINNEKFLKVNFSLRNRIKKKLEGGSPEHPSDYDLEETLAIIGEGGGNKALASLLAENAANKNALVIQNAQRVTPVLPAIRKTGAYSMLKRNYESLLNVYRQTGNYRIKYLNLLDKLEKKGMTIKEIWELTNRPKGAGAGKRRGKRADAPEKPI